jgi:hypothetical protein
MKTMKTFKLPTWAESNNVTRFTSMLGYDMTRKDAIARVKANDKVASFLNKNGWTFTEWGNVAEDGYVLNFRKPTGIVTDDKAAHPYLHFGWYWDNCGGPDFWRGDLWTSYGYDREFKYLGPVGFFEIHDILQRNLKDLYQYERQLVHALISQTPIPNGNR